MLGQPRERHELLWALTFNELTVRYKRATLGILWTVLNPVLQMDVLTIVFVVIPRIPIRRYTLFLMPGLLLWTFSPIPLASSEQLPPWDWDQRDRWVEASGPLTCLKKGRYEGVS